MNEMTPTTAGAITFDQVQTFLHAEARALDDRQWDDWLTFYHPDCQFWMPAWDDFDTLTEDPRNEMSLIYYPDRTGLEEASCECYADVRKRFEQTMGKPIG